MINNNDQKNSEAEILDLKNNSDVDNTLYEILNKEIITEEGQQFIINFQMYLKFGNDDTQYVIDLDDVWNWLGFTSKGNSKRLFIKNFEQNNDYIIINSLLPKDKQVHGGQNKEIIKMNVNTFKSFCMIANTERGKTTRKYYLKMENIFFKYCENLNKNIIERMNIENKIMIEKLQLDNKITIQSIEEDNILYNIKKNHEILLNAHRNKSLVYMLQIECPFIDKNFKLIKIGSSDDIVDRVSKIKNTFGCDIYIIHAFQCENNRGFEKFLLNHHKICPYKYKELIGNNRVNSIECFLLRDNNMVQSVKRVIENNILYFKAKNLEEKKLDLELIRETNIKNKLDLEKNKLKLYEELIHIYKEKPDELLHSLQYINNHIKIDEIDNKYANIIDNNINTEDNDTINSNNTNQIDQNNSNMPINRIQGPIVQIYDQYDLNKLIKVFDSITSATREIPNSSYTSIKFASKNKINYLNYRWHLIDRNDINPLLPRDIGITLDINVRRTGLVAMLNLNKSIIEKVFTNQKEASAYISQECSAMSNSIKYNKPLSGNFWIYWDDLDEQLKKSYVDIHTLPIINKNIRGKQIEQLEPNTLHIIKIHQSIMDVCKEFHMSPKTVKKVIIEEKIYNGFIWKIKN